MATSFGGSVKLTGESEYRKALKDITSNLREVSSQLKLANVQFNSGEKTLKDTQTTYANVNSTIQQQKDKINSLRTALAAAEKEYGANNEKVRSFKTQLNNAEAELLQMESATGKSNKELKEMKTGFDEAGQSTITFGDLLKANVLGDMITSGIKAIGSAIKEVGSAILNFGKQSLDSYANYEQLVGGVETLFKDSAGIVENYANNAYQTAGLSANEYMETVTSFSASLLQSLNGDTAKSAEVADMAITDMSDNANKMGTDMTLIQNAYQGFAKQNYTMLDNLKLGYGGTKEEMQRLLADAQKITGVKYDISNLNDVFNAIHVIQEELGVAGTTSLEASTTIQGSVASMKSAWQNMLTGIATGSGETIGDLVNNLTDSVITASQNILPRVQEIVDGIVIALPQIVQKINENLPSILQTGTQILQSLINGITTTLPSLMPMVTELITTLLDFVLENLPTIIDLGVQLLLSLVQGISQSLPQLIPTVLEAIMTIVDNLLNNIDQLIDAGIQLLMGLADGLINALPQLVDKIPTIIDKLITAITNNMPKMMKAGITLIIKLAEGLIKAIPQLISKIPEIIGALVSGFGNYISNIWEIGKNIVSGIWEGIKNAKDWLIGKVKEWCGNLLDGIKNFFGIHSPSKVFNEQVGTNLALGIGEGFSNTMKDVSKDMSNSIPTEFEINAKENITSSTNTNKVDKLIDILNDYLPQLISASNKQLVLDTGVLVGATVDQYNIALGNIQNRGKRGS